MSGVGVDLSAGSFRSATPFPSQEVGMTYVIETRSKGRRAATYAAGLAISSLLSLGTFVPSASADEYQTDIHSWDRNDDLGNSRWGGIHYVVPAPADYSAPFTGTPSSYPLRVFHGPGVAISLPGINIGIQ
jgi:hypothetical protein